jgi:hypothetical protein
MGHVPQARALVWRVRVLQDLAAEVRHKTLQILQAARATELTWAPPGTANHLLWHAGHALWLQDALGIERVTGRSELPPGYAELFQMGSRPGRSRGAWPTREELCRHLQAQLPRLQEVIGTISDADLDRRPRHAHPGDDRTLGHCILHGLHDEANHQGEMYLLLKMQRLGPAGTR